MCKSCKLCKYLAAIIFTAAVFFAAGWLVTIHSLSIDVAGKEVYVVDQFGIEWSYTQGSETTR